MKQTESLTSHTATVNSDLKAQGMRAKKLIRRTLDAAMIRPGGAPLQKLLSSQQ